MRRFESWRRYTPLLWQLLHACELENSKGHDYQPRDAYRTLSIFGLRYLIRDQVLPNIDLSRLLGRLALRLNPSGVTRVLELHDVQARDNIWDFLIGSFGLSVSIIITSQETLYLLGSNSSLGCAFPHGVFGALPRFVFGSSVADFRLSSSAVTSSDHWQLVWELASLYWLSVLVASELDVLRSVLAATLVPRGVKVGAIGLSLDFYSPISRTSHH